MSPRHYKITLFYSGKTPRQDRGVWVNPAFDWLATWPSCAVALRASAGDMTTVS